MLRAESAQARNAHWNWRNFSVSFPDVPRVRYEINPLDEVICQFRFPPILRIDSESPSRFQDAVRGEYPLYESQSSPMLPSGFPREIAKAIGSALPIAGHLHAFAAKDQSWRIALHREFLALSCRCYEQWEAFRDRLRVVHTALLDSYAPSFLSCVELRYKNVVNRSKLGLTDAPWSELLQPWVTGVLGSADCRDDVGAAQSNWLIRLPQIDAKVRLAAGLAAPQAEAKNPSAEVVFLMDANFFTCEREVNDVFNRADELNRQARLLFRWLITDRLHDALRPAPV